jgi:hypothetical protein
MPKAQHINFSTSLHLYYRRLILTTTSQTLSSPAMVNWVTTTPRLQPVLIPRDTQEPINFLLSDDRHLCAEPVFLEER